MIAHEVDGALVSFLWEAGACLHAGYRRELPLGGCKA